MESEQYVQQGPCFMSQQLFPSDHSWIELSSPAFAHNVAQMKRLLRLTDKLAFVAKANAYGHGLIPMATIADTTKGVDWIAVFFLSEALQLRNNGIKKPILVLGCIDADPIQALGLNIDFMVDNIATINQLGYAAEKQRYVCHVHIKIDTGLSRFGIHPSDVNTFITYIQKNPFLHIIGILTHLAESNNENTDFTHQQLHSFNQVLAQVQKLNVSIPFIHATNTAGVMYFNTEKFTFFRVGIGLYGFFPSPHIKKFLQEKYPHFHLFPVLTWKSKIIAIKKISRGSYVSYNRTCQVNRDTVCAFIPVGYSDGYDFASSNGIPVLVNGSKAKVLGKIAMNVTIIDVTDITHPCIGDEVILCGATDDSINIATIASTRDLKNIRSFLARIPIHIPRFITR